MRSFYTKYLLGFEIHGAVFWECYTKIANWQQRYGSIHLNSLKSTPPPSDIFHFYTIHRYIKARKILKISGQNTYGNYIFYVSGDCHFCLLGFLKIPFSDIEFSFKLPKFEKYPFKLPANTYLYRLLSKDSKNHT